MFLYNIHTPSKTFALQAKDDDTYSSLLERIAAKAGLPSGDVSALKQRKDGASLVYEFKGERWSLEDDDDLAILQDRLPPSSTPSATLHLTPPQHHAHFAPPAYSTASSTVKSKTKKTRTSAGSTNGQSPRKETASTSNGHLAPPTLGKAIAKDHAGDEKTPAAGKPVGKTADGTTVSKPRSIMSTRSRKSKWGNDDAEPLGDVHKRQWLEFHSNNGVRTVTGKVGKVDNVRMLLKSGYKQVYISRSFAVKAGLVSGKFGMGSSGYTGLKTLGHVPITVGSRTAEHPALINEESHFDVVLGRQWLEKMNVKIDPLDQTALTYMDSGEAIPCDLVVLKDPQGNVITVT